MSMTLLPLAPEPARTTRLSSPAPLWEELATLRQQHAALRTENAALRAKRAVLHERVQKLEARLAFTASHPAWALQAGCSVAIARTVVRTPSGKRFGAGGCHW
jgi:hypothetical protein